MKIGKLRKTIGFWKSLFFMENICKMRNALIGYLAEEGIKSEVQEGQIVFEYNSCLFGVNYIMGDGYTECVVRFLGEDEDYTLLNMEDKALVADKVNTDEDNHAVVMTSDTRFAVKTSFYFTSKQMMLDLFCQHFQELTVSLYSTIELIKAKIDERKHKCRKIGFYTQRERREDEQQENRENQVAAKR